MRELSMLSGSDLRSSVTRVLVTSVLVGLLFGTLGPFGTFERMETGERYGFWLACFLGGAFVHVPACWLSRTVGALYGSSQLVLLPLSAVVAAVPMTLMVNGIAVSLLRAANLDGFFELYPFVLAISLPVQLMSHLLQLWSEGRLAAAAAPAGARPAEAVMPLAGSPPAAAPAPQPPTDVVPAAAPVAAPATTLDAAPAAAPQAPPRFLARIPARLGRDLLALEMEDHYLRIHTRLGSDLILMRMRDAVAELDGLDGLQVHRSWWVARRAVERVERDGKTMTLTLANNHAVPVARDRQGEVRAAGWL